MTPSGLAPVQARELTTAERAEWADQAQAVQTRVFQSMGDTRAALWALGEALWEFNEISGWGGLGYSTQAEWLAQPEVNMTGTDFYRLVRRHRELIVERSLDVEMLRELDPSKIDIVMPTVEEGKVSYEQIFSDVKTLGARDLKDKYIGPRAQRNTPPHDGVGLDAPGLGEDEDESTIEGKVAPVGDDPPVVAGDANPEMEAAVKINQEMAHAAGVVESWFELGGDRRKAMRNWRKLNELHPAIGAISQLELLFAGAEEAPSKEDASLAWKILVEGLSLTVETE